MKAFFVITYQIHRSETLTATIGIWADSIIEAVQKFEQTETSYFDNSLNNQASIIQIKRAKSYEGYDMMDTLSVKARFVAKKVYNCKVYREDDEYIIDADGHKVKFDTMKNVNGYLEGFYQANAVEMQYENDGEWYHIWDTFETDLWLAWQEMDDDKPTEGGHIRFEGSEAFVIVNGGFDED